MGQSFALMFAMFLTVENNRSSATADVAKACISLGVHSNASTWLHYGNELARSNRLPDAIFIYRQGLALHPSHTGLRQNLLWARSQVSYPSPGHGQPETLPWPIAPSHYFLASAIGFAVLVIVMIRFRWRPSLAPVFLGLYIIFLGFFLLGKATKPAEFDRTLTVISADEVPFLRGNGESYPANEQLPLLRRSMEAREIGRRGDWIQLLFATGEIGWVPRRAVLVADP